MTQFQSELIKQAGSQLGVTEATGHNDGVAVEAYLKAVGLGKGYAWCMAFVYWCAKNAAIICVIKNPLYQTGGVQVEWESKNGTRITEPEPGAVFFLHHPGGWHTGICTSGAFADRTFHSIEGNSNTNGSRDGNEVVRHTRKIADMVGFKRY